MNDEAIQVRIHGPPAHPTLIYLPGMHGDWTLVSSFRAAVNGRVRFVEFTYPRISSWSLDDYAQAVVQRLDENGITQGWLLAESFSSQVAWRILERADKGFEPLGLILAGGFVRYPITWGLRAFHAAHRLMPWWAYRMFLWCYERYARLRHRRAPETFASVGEFVQRRTRADREAIASRYPLIAAADFRHVAGRVKLPVFGLSGFFDPIVPWPLVQPSLRRRCPALRGTRVIFNADHNVLGTAPGKAAEQILHWMRA